MEVENDKESPELDQWNEDIQAQMKLTEDYKDIIAGKTPGEDTDKQDPPQ
jgi:hypothetical protein